MYLKNNRISGRLNIVREVLNIKLLEIFMESNGFNFISCAKIYIFIGSELKIASVVYKEYLM